MTDRQAKNVSDLEELQGEAVQVLMRRMKAHNGTLEEGSTAPPSQDTAKEALLTLSAVGRLKQTQSAREATQFMVLRTLAKDEKSFEKYLAVSLPHLNPIPLIEDKGKQKQQTKE